MGKTPRDLARDYRQDTLTQGGAYHRTAGGGPMSVASAAAGAGCATATVNVRNPA